MLKHAGVFASSSQLLRQVRAHYRKQYLRAISPLEALAGAQRELQFVFVFVFGLFFNRALPEASTSGPSRRSRPLQVKNLERLETLADVC
jgi:hypothetical protein